jgi:hypothetical protein
MAYPEDMMSRIVILTLAAVAAALLFGVLAHDELGIPPSTIRKDALAGVAVVGIALLARSMQKRIK